MPVAKLPLVLLAPLLAAAALLHSPASALAAAVGERFPFQQQQIATNCDTSTILCKLEFPAVPVGRRREITFATCYFQMSENGQLNFLSLRSDPRGFFVSLIPVKLNDSGIRQYQSNDQFMLHMAAGNRPTIAVGLVNNVGGAWVSGLSCLISGETIVTQ